jgi:hypothetical protein
VKNVFLSAKNRQKKLNHKMIIDNSSMLCFMLDFY